MSTISSNQGILTAMLFLTNNYDISFFYRYWDIEGQLELFPLLLVRLWSKQKNIKPNKKYSTPKMKPFLDAAPHFYKTLCPLVGWLVRRSVRQSVGRSISNEVFFFAESDYKQLEMIDNFL